MYIARNANMNVSDINMSTKSRQEAKTVLEVTYLFKNQ